jgi:hypothetical protein
MAIMLNNRHFPRQARFGRVMKKRRGLPENWEGPGGVLGLR